MMLPIAENPVMTNLSDYLFFQQPEIIYGSVVLFIAVGILFWLFGNQFHRLFLTVLFLGFGILAGWYLAGIYNVDVFLSMIIGALLGAGLGYWFFRLWLAILGAILIWIVLTAITSWQFAIPYLQLAASEYENSLHQGIKLMPDTTSMPGESLTNHSDRPGQAYAIIKELVPKLSPREYKNWQDWRENFLPVLQRIFSQLRVIIPHLMLSTYLLAGIALVIGVVLALLRPTFLNIFYTSLLGVLLICFGIFILLILKKTEQMSILTAYPWIGGLIPALMWIGGMFVQYYRLPEQEEDEEDDDEEEEPAPRKSKGKKK